MSSPPDPQTVRHARSSKLVAYLALAYLLLVVYASLYPFSGWRAPNSDAVRFLFAGWQPYIVASDVVLNIIAYVPLGLLVTLFWMGRMRRSLAAVTGVMVAALLSTCIEYVQAYLPTRISSNLDVMTNTIGAVWGASAAVAWGERWLLSGELRRLRMRHFLPGARTDVAFALLALWLLTQLNAEIWLFGNGDLRQLVPTGLGMAYSANAYLLLEAGVAALNFAGIAFLVGAIATSYASTATAVMSLVVVALLLKTIAAMSLFVPGNPGLWLTPGSVLGLVVGVMAWLPISRRSKPAAIRLSALCFAAAAVLVNIAPENPYLVAALKILQRGQFLHFNAMTGLLSSCWSYLVLGYLAYRMLPPSAAAAPTRSSP